MTGDIGNTYINTNTEEKIYTRAGTRFELLGIMDEGNLLDVVKALFGLPTSGNRWHAHLLHTWRKMNLSQLVMTRVSVLGGARQATITS